MNLGESAIATKRVIIIGSGGHATSVAETVTACGFELISFVSENSESEMLLDRPILNSIPPGHTAEGGVFAIGIGDNQTRERVMLTLLKEIDRQLFPFFIHPTASVSSFAEIGLGTVILQGAVVGSSATIGIGCLLNSSSVTEHECSVGDFASIAPNATLGGRATVGARSAISIGASVKHGITIGSDSVIGAQSYVNKNVPDGVVVYGIPARFQRDRLSTDPYLS